MHTNAYQGFMRHIAPRVASGMRVLEISPARRVYQKALRSVGVTPDYWVASPGYGEGDHIVAMPGEYRLDCPDGSFDAVWSSSVLEHVRRPWLWIPELARVVRPGGFVGVISPITWEEHRVRGPGGRCDAWRIMPDGMRALFEDAGLVAEVIVAVSTKEDTEKELASNRGPAIDLASVGRKPLGAA